MDRSVWRSKRVWALLAATILAAACTSTSTTAPTSGGGASGAPSAPAASQAAPATAAPATTAPGAAASAAPGTGTKTIGVVALCASCGGAHRYFVSLQDEAKSRGWTLNLVDTAGDVSKAGPAIEAFINSKVDAIVDMVIDPSALGDSIQKANAAHIPFITMSTGWVPGVAFQVTANNFEMGALQGTYVADRMNRQGSVAMITFSAASDIRDRANAFKNVIASYPGMKIVDIHEVNVAKALDDAQQYTSSLLVRYPSGLGQIWAGWDDPGLGAAAAIDAAGRKDVFVIGNDADPAVQDLIRKGSSFNTDVFVDYGTMGKITATQMDKIFAGGQPDSPHFYIDLTLVGKNNVPPAGQMPPAQGYHTDQP